MDTLRLGSNEGRAKLLGTLLGVGGALVFVFYKGFELHIWSTHVDLLKSSGQSSGPATENHHHISISGVLMVFGCNVSVSLWLLLQARTTFFIKHYFKINIIYTVFMCYKKKIQYLCVFAFQNLRESYYLLDIYIHIYISTTKDIFLPKKKLKLRLYSL